MAANESGPPLFPLGSPVAAEDLVAREAVIATLVRRLADGQNLVIAAPRGVGKTSVVIEALRRLRELGFYTARVDIFAATSRAELAEQLADRCLENRTRLRRSIRTIREFARSALGTFRPTITVQDVEISLSLAQEGAGESQLLRDALSLPERLAEQDRRRVVVAWDEFQDVMRLDSRAEGEMLRIIRAELQQQPSVSHVFLGAQESVLRTIFGSPSHAFYRFAPQLPFPPVPGPDEWMPYLQRKYASRDLNISEVDARQLASFSGGHPLDTMVLAAAAYYTALEFRATEITSTIVWRAFDRALDELAPYFDELWVELGERSGARVVAQRLALGQSLTAEHSGRKLHPQQAQHALQFLQRKGIIVREGRGKYRFLGPMFAEYVRRLVT